MQKKQLFVYINTMLLFFMISSAAVAQVPKLDKSPHDISYYPARGSDKVVKVVYGRPQKKGRETFGGLAPYGKVWRTGANEATEIKFYKDVMIGDKSVKAGSYALFTIPEEKKWTIIISSDLDTWGAYTYKEASDVARVEVKTDKSQEVVEAFSIYFKEVEGGAHMVLVWDKTMVEVPIKW